MRAQTAYLMAASCTLQAHTAREEHVASLSLAKCVQPCHGDAVCLLAGSNV